MAKKIIYKPRPSDDVEYRIVELDPFAAGVLVATLGSQVKYFNFNGKDGSRKHGFFRLGHPLTIYHVT